VYLDTQVSFISYMYIFCIVVKLATILRVLTLEYYGVVMGVKFCGT